MKEIAWVFGSSAAGKETFIRELTSSESHPAQKNFDWIGKKVPRSYESLGGSQSGMFKILLKGKLKQYKLLLIWNEARLK